MGLFDKKNTDDKEYLKRLNKIIDDLNYTYNYTYSQSADKTFIQYLMAVEKDPGSAKIQPLGLLVETVSAIIGNKSDFNINTYTPAMKKAGEIYDKVFPFGEATPDFDMLAMAFINFFRPNGLGAEGLFNNSLFATFKNKQNYIDFMNTIRNDAKLHDSLYDIIQYGLSVRAFFIDDDTYTTNMKQVAARMLASGDRASVAKEEIKRVEHMAGIYDIDQADVAKTEQQLVKANAMLNEIMGILEQADKKTEQLNRVMKDTSDSIQEIAKRETELLSIKANSARDDINAAYNSFLEEQRQEVILQKDVLLNQIFAESETKLNELRSMSRAVTATANAELLRINTETTNAMDKINNYVSIDKELEKILPKADENKELFDKIAKLEILNTQNIEAMAKTVEAQTANGGMPVAAPQMVVAGAPGAHVGGLPPMELAPEAIPEVNPLLDTNIPFETRYKMVMDEKARREKAGEHFHKMFDDVVTVLMEDANPYLIGPSGCGKTYMVNQIAQILGLDFIDIGYINEEYDILGFQTATGDYSTPNFYRCYKYGKIAFCDELDNGNARATVKLNSFLSNNKNASYSFPHGENVRRHANFRIIAAGNTAGNGADSNYNTREKIEESVQQRFTPVYVGYDNAVEAKILENYKDWYYFVVLFRMATDAWGNQNDCAAAGIFTTRDAARIKRYLDNKSLDMGRILDYEFIQTKDMEYLAFLVKHIASNVQNYQPATQIFTMFQDKVNALREKGGLR